MVELPKTEDELNTLIESKVNAKVEELTSKHNGEMANMRKSYEDKIKKAQDQANLTAEEKAQQLAKEKELETQQELNDLRAFKKSTTLKERLTKEGLPSFLANDNRLLSAEEGDLDKVIKVVKGEYEANLPKGNTHSSVIQVTSQQATANKDSLKDEAFRKAGEVLNNVFGK